MSILANLLIESEAYDPEYGGGLCNHLPLALTALDQMGATPSQLNDYRRTHVSWLEKLPEREAAPAWEAAAKTTPSRGISSNIKSKRKVPALFKTAAQPN